MKYILAICIIVFPSVVFSQNASIRRGNKFYREGKFNLAVPEYQKSLSMAGDEMIASYNMGNTYFRSGKLAEASKSFEKTLAASGKQTSMQQRAYYNRGVAFSKDNKLEESIVMYKNALKLNPADEDARVNLQKALLELRKKQPQKKQDENDQKKKQKENRNKNQQKQQPKSNLSKKEVERLLKALQQREQQVQQKMQQRNNRTAGQQEKDW